MQKQPWLLLQGWAHFHSSDERGQAGDHVVFGDVIYGCSYTLFAKVLTKLGVTYTVWIQPKPKRWRNYPAKHLWFM